MQYFAFLLRNQRLSTTKHVRDHFLCRSLVGGGGGAEETWQVTEGGGGGANTAKK